MSITIDWAALTTGPSGLALADSIRDFIHDKFQQVTLPRFIRSVHVHSFDFGEECPIVELKDISDPLPEFYEEEDDDDDDHDDGDSSPSEVEAAKEEARSEAAPKHPLPSSPHQSNNVPQTTTKPPTSALNTRLSNLHLNLRSTLPFTPSDQLSAPFLSRSTTPGLPIPGGTSNFSYFHLPLSAGLSGTTTPLPWPEHPPRPASPPLQRHETTHIHPLSKPTITTTSSNPPYQRTNRTPHPSTTIPPLPNNNNNRDDEAKSRALDIQTTLHITYTGTLSLSLTAEILLDYPMPSFVGIPLKLHITGLSFDGVALLAYLRRRTAQKKDVVHFCFLTREDAGAVVGSGDGDGDGGGLLKEIRVESEIGRQEGGKQVLKNVGKVEKFVLEQVRRIFEEEFVWPSFWTFLV